MMIEKHISALLYRYQCVIVPGFGAFLTETSSARFNELTGTFSPPKKMISFNSQLKNNDGLLGNHVALEENLSYDEALISIRDGVFNWKETLDQNKTLYLKNIGEIQLNDEHKLIFEPIGSTNYLTSSFGLSSILAANVERSKSEKEQPVVIPIQKAKKETNYLKYAAILVVGLGLFSSFMNYRNNQELDNQKSNIEKQVQKEVQNKIQQATFFIDTPKALNDASKIVDEKIIKEEEQLRYHIVAGSFRTVAKAQILVDQLKEKGFSEAKYLGKSKHGMRPVIYSSFKTKEEAQKELNNIHLKANKDAWVYIEE
ncbi:SPOR domain-containing protein [Flavobacterium sp. I3-2]|uniref:HU domain-containing protein n=1 Tax=Flavobacterium sp. I3-2 TaxID=2748319 RepID=UPI0015B2B330|nr:SPOR domain-containing protein [Flavobacterium sp. I3-2]